MIVQEQETILSRFLKVEQQQFPIQDPIDLRVNSFGGTVKLHTVEYPNEGELKGILFVFLGFGAYIDFHGVHLKQFAKAGFRVFGMDRQGFGSSEGNRGDIGPNQVQDQLDFVDAVVQQYSLQDEKKYLFGISLGGLLSTRMIQLRPNYFSGVILCVPWFQNHESVKIQGLKRLLLRVIGNLFWEKEIPTKSRTHEFDEYQEYIRKNDQKIVVNLKYSTVNECMNLQDTVATEIEKLNDTAVFMAVAENDWSVSNEKIDEVFSNNNHSLKKKVLYKDAIHAFMQPIEDYITRQSSIDSKKNIKMVHLYQSESNHDQ
ncbi:UNKNOWN [Stylonychia lemnae]|uniref:Serine aminopeptidase S33 domain-containing protein n=1 Tax=Stylonychia lemnae TaxID=5949 RepID=A0A077ZT06_STYLE|nr:UNKNOWN [Stylonychia lemnae]|eukprot:CDW73017.1 UNKNOWN [Stylonychia lemnae]